MRFAEWRPSPPSTNRRDAMDRACCASTSGRPPMHARKACASAYPRDSDGGSVRSVVGPRGGAHRQKKPAALQIRRQWQLLQGFELLVQPLRCPRADKVRVPDGRAQHDDPSLGWCLVARLPRPAWRYRAGVGGSLLRSPASCRDCMRSRIFNTGMAVPGPAAGWIVVEWWYNLYIRVTVSGRRLWGCQA